MESNSFNLTKEKKKNRNGKILPTIIFSILFGFIGACLAMYLLFNNFIKNDQINKFLGLNNVINEKEIFNESKEKENTKLVVDLKDFNETSIGVAKKVLPSIVNIDIEYEVNTIFSSKTTATGTGSGVIVSKDGYILTNNHVVSPRQENQFFVVSDAKKVTVTLANDKKYDAKIIGVDKVTDLAVVKIDAKEDLTPATFGNSDNTQIGEFVMAIGSPLGFRGSVTDGIISSLNRKIELKDGSSFTAIQTNASINSGNSGGALVNSKGEVIGINTLKLSGGGIEGLGFAIPINQTKPIIKQLIENKKVERPSLGFTGKEISEAISKEYNLPKGIMVKDILKESTAEKVGLKEKDIVTKLNGKSATTFSEIEKLKTDLKYDEEITITVFRDGKEQELKGKVVKLPETNKKENKESNQEEKREENKENLKQKSNDLYDFFFNN